MSSFDEILFPVFDIGSEVALETENLHVLLPGGSYEIVITLLIVFFW